MINLYLVMMVLFDYVLWIIIILMILSKLIDYIFITKIFGREFSIFPESKFTITKKMWIFSIIVAVVFTGFTIYSAINGFLNLPFLLKSLLIPVFFCFESKFSEVNANFTTIFFNNNGFILFKQNYLRIFPLLHKYNWSEIESIEAFNSTINKINSVLKFKNSDKKIKVGFEIEKFEDFKKLIEKHITIDE
jgi:hypothetical protein